MTDVRARAITAGKKSYGLPREKMMDFTRGSGSGPNAAKLQLLDVIKKLRSALFAAEMAIFFCARYPGNFSVVVNDFSPLSYLVMD